MKTFLFLPRNLLFTFLPLVLLACNSSELTSVSELTFDVDANMTIEENVLVIDSVSATSSNGNVISYSIIGGADDALFVIDSSTATLSFIIPPDFEAPIDSDSNNIYQVEVSATDGENSLSLMLAITVTNFNDIAPVFTSASTVMVDENTTNVATVNGVDAEGDTLIYSLTGGTDQLQFIVDTTSGLLMFANVPDFEAPADANMDNSYQVQVSANDGVHTVNLLMTVDVANLDDTPVGNAPVITSASAISIEENNATALTVAASDSDGDSITYSLIGGIDQAQFAINSMTGVLIFNTLPDFEAPVDADTNNTYLVQVSASDGTNSVNQQVTVTVTDIYESQFGLDVRPSNPNCIISLAPVTASGIQLTRVFSDLSFTQPVALRQSPVNQDRWYVVERAGTIRTFLANDTASTVFATISSVYSGSELEMGLLGFAFHPNYAINKYVYVNYTSVDPRRTTISRFTAISDTQLDPASEQIILVISQPDTNHNGGNILFGPDGYLYIGMGDGGGAGDVNNNAQNIDSLLGKILRINVDNPSNGKNYSSPSTNPYVGTAGLDEIYALGLRNPWRWSFDRVTGDFIVADVGQSTWEEVDVIVNGGNYGWRCYEGNHSYNTSGCQPQSNYVAAVHEYDHNTGISITGGYVYRGSAIPSLVGTYVYSDYSPGPIWGLANPTGQTPVNTALINSNSYISSFAEDNNGEIYVVSFGDGQIFRIDPASIVANAFPTLLSDTGCVNTNNPLEMASGLIPYEINAPFWSDGITKDRWMALPDGSSIDIELDGDWTFPVNSILVKNFTINNVRVETRLLIRHEDGNWGGYSYEWNNAQTDASLVLNGKITTKQGQAYIYPSTTECMICHTPVTGFVLGPETIQLNRDEAYMSTGITANQLTTLDHIGVFSTNLTDIPGLPKLTNPVDISASMHDRARAYLYTNCSQCHRQGGPTDVSLDFHVNTADADMNVCNANPTHQIGGAAAILAPGNAAGSSMYLRLSCRDTVAGCAPDDKMPPLGSAYVDTAGATIVASWINSLATCP